jgi:hypothetical protein
MCVGIPERFDLSASIFVFARRRIDSHVQASHE